MKLSKLVYLCVKNVLYLNDSSFNYESFLLGDFDADPDYDTNINNVFTPVNEAIARLNDLDRIPYKIAQCKFIPNTNQIDLDNLLQDETNTSIKVKELVGVGQMPPFGMPRSLEFSKLGKKVVVLDYTDIRFPLYVEYKEDIPFFTRDDIPEKDASTGELYEEDDPLYSEVELEDYNIGDSLCNYIIEYVQGKLLEPIAPDIANMHVTRAEAYFSNTTPVLPVFRQRVVKKVNKIED